MQDALLPWWTSPVDWSYEGEEEEEDRNDRAKLLRRSCERLDTRYVLLCLLSYLFPHVIYNMDLIMLCFPVLLCRTTLTCRRLDGTTASPLQLKSTTMPMQSDTRSGICEDYHCHNGTRGTLCMDVARRIVGQLPTLAALFYRGSKTNDARPPHPSVIRVANTRPRLPSSSGLWLIW